MMTFLDGKITIKDNMIEDDLHEEGGAIEDKMFNSAIDGITSLLLALYQIGALASYGSEDKLINDAIRTAIDGAFNNIYM